MRSKVEADGYYWQPPTSVEESVVIKILAVGLDKMMEYELSQTPSQSADSLEHHKDVSIQPSKYTEASTQTDPEKEPPVKEISPYVTGLKLGAVVAGTTLVVFLIMLDVSIISTVSQPQSD